MTCPIEAIIANALDARGIRYTTEGRHPEGFPPLDFHLTDFGVFIEVKQFHSDRIARQMAQADSVIAIQGRAAAEAFATLLHTGED